jgi:SAM-dependent methyltransferase
MSQPRSIEAGRPEPQRRLDSLARHEVRTHFEDKERSRLQDSLRAFYYDDLYGFIRSQVPRGARVLDLGCGDGSLLASLEPSLGVGVDASASLVSRAKRQHPDLHFICGDVEELPLVGEFDYVVVSNLVGYLLDALTFFKRLRSIVGPGTRIVIAYYNFAWEPILKLAQVLHLKSKDPLQNWLSSDDLMNLLSLAGFEPIIAGYRTVLPVGPKRLGRVINRFLGVIPLVRRLGITSYVTARRAPAEAAMEVKDPSVTVVIPTRNERGNIRSAIERLPALGSHTEVIFVDGGSTDGTPEEIQIVIEENPKKNIKLIHQGNGIGKGDAVRKGFDAATGDVLMILDADLTVPPEELPKFWNALVEDKGEFINGTRLVYPMEDEAMRLANVIGNKFFRIVFSWILQQRITDTLCGTKVLWKRDYERIASNRSHFGDFDPFGDFDLLFGAANLGLKIQEIPVRYRNRAYGSTNISRWRHGVLLLRMAVIGARKLRLR